jgi:hypothetical protein
LLGDPGFHWPEVRGYAKEFFTYWPDGEDLLWAKKVWPKIEANVNFGIGQDGVDGHTQSLLHAGSLRGVSFSIGFAGVQTSRSPQQKVDYGLLRVPKKFRPGPVGSRERAQIRIYYGYGRY